MVLFPPQVIRPEQDNLFYSDPDDQYFQPRCILTGLIKPIPII